MSSELGQRDSSKDLGKRFTFHLFALIKMALFISPHCNIQQTWTEYEQSESSCLYKDYGQMCSDFFVFLNVFITAFITVLGY